MSDFSQIIHNFSEPIPQYVLVCLPAIAIAGASPANMFTKKLMWILRCLGCPFIGIFYSVNVGSSPESRCLFWLPADKFTNDGKVLSYRPFGVYAMRLEDNPVVKEYVDRCTAKTSDLERLSSIIPMYYIIIGVLDGISRAAGSVACDDWPDIPLLLSWTIPALWRRISSGNLVVKDPKKEFEKFREKIIMNVEPGNRGYKPFNVFLTAFISILYPWITILLTYFTPPIGLFCRSKYITIICSIWSFNNTLAYLSHLRGKKDIIEPLIFHFWFSFCGFIVAILLLFLGLLNKNSEWWIGLLGQSCDISSAGC
ncbi:1465_t:CDS:1 [Dentiscutata erythropus]|uniref:1465_t:CDS:1 n=1 Tax=Dentiscutata erythropus TaxID=1348616 RepID=A0A9N9E6I0_9GLOM|nr:1465_t:CDS:1 [Dentiscutata erythropus]